MKNAFKFGALVVVVAATVVACDPPTAKSTETKIDTPKTKVDTPAKTAIDTAKKDTTTKK